MSKILIIDDEMDLVMLLEDELKAKGHEVLIAYDGQAGIELSKQEPDLIILDIMMPKMNGFEVCQAIRDDYVTKPFGLRELMARIEANLRREKRSQYINEENKRSTLYFGKLCLYMKERAIKIDGKNIDLTKIEYDIVELLALHAGQVFSREQIYEKVWGCDSEGDSSTVVERVKKIRAKFSAVTPEKEYISTVWGIGYKWNKM